MRKIICVSMFCFSVVLVSAQNKAFDSISNEIDQNSFFQYHKTKTLLDELYQIAYQSPDSIKFLAECITKEAKLYSDHSIVDTLLKKRIDGCISLLDSIEDKRGAMILGYSLSLYNYGVGDYGEAFINGLQALEKSEQLIDSVYIAKSFGLLGNICNDINQPYLSDQYFTEQLAYTEENSADYFRTKQNCYIILAHEQKYDDFIDSLETLISQAKQKLEEKQLITIYLNLLNAYLSKNKLNDAYACLQKCNELSQHIDNNSLKIGLYTFTARYMRQTKDFRAALDYYMLAYQLNKSDVKGYHLRTIYSGFASCYEALDNKDSLIFYQKRYQQVLSKEYYQSRSIKVYQQYISNYLELTENQLALARQDALLQKRGSAFFFILSILIIVALFFIILLINQQRRRKTAEAAARTAEIERQQAEIIAQEARLEAHQAKDEMQQAKIREMHYQKKIDEAKKKEQQEQIEQKKRELASLSLLIAKNKEMAQDISKLTDQIKNSEGDVADLTEKIDRIIHDEQLIDNAWNDFVFHFEKVHPKFFLKLKKRAPHLTEDNLKMCVYFRIGYTRKEISAIYGITTQSVANQRVRIKKKLQLSEEEDLDTFLKKL